MTARTTEQRQEANRLISEHYGRATPKGLTTPEWNGVIWRYVDLPKLVDMLTSSSLPLIRLDKFEDKWEGFSAPLADDEYRGFFANNQKNTDFERFQMGEQLRKFYYASCWHLNHIESDAMWKLYLSGTEGVALRTTYQRLLLSLRETSDEFLVGKVQYPQKPSPGLSMLLTCMTKREPFVHESELRVIWHDSAAEQAWRNDGHASNTDQPTVKRLRCDLSQLIDCLAISPQAGEWFANAIRGLLDKCALEGIKVTRSGLSGQPPWPCDDDGRRTSR